MSTLNVMELSNAQLQHAAPSAFAAQPYVGQSQRYAFIPTSNVIDGMRAAGFVPVRATQSLARIEGKRAFTKHMVRFRQAGAQVQSVGDSVLETVLVNSHDGSSAYDLSMGMFRLACLNGLMVAESLVGSIHIRHTGDVVNRVIEGSTQLIQSAGRVLDVVEAWRQIQLSQAEQLVLAEGAHSLRFEDDSPLAQAVTPDKLLLTRRYDDTGADLWSTFNRVQENTVRGGLRGYVRNEAGRVTRRTRTREVKGIDQNVRLNRALWSLAEKMAEIKQTA